MKPHLAFKDKSTEKYYKAYNFNKRKLVLQMQRGAVGLFSFLGIFHMIYLHPKQEEISTKMLCYLIVATVGLLFFVVLGFFMRLRQKDWIILTTNLVINFILIEPNFLVIAENRVLSKPHYFWLGFRISSINLITLMCYNSFLYKIAQTSITITFLMIRMREEATLHNLLVDSGVGILTCVFFYNQERGERLIYHDLHGISEQKEGWKDFLNFLPDGIGIFTNDFNTIFMNDGVKNIFRLSDQDDLKRTIFNLSKTKSDFSEMKDSRSPSGHWKMKDQFLLFNELIPRKSPKAKQGLARRKTSRFSIVEGSKYTLDSGSMESLNDLFFSEHNGKFLSLKLTHIDFEGKGSTLVLISDVSVSIRAQKQALEENKKFRDLLFASFSHEIRTPLNCIMLLLGKLIDKNLSLPEKVLRKYIYPSFYSGQILLHLVNNILDYSSLIRGDLELKIGEIDIKSDCLEVMDVISIQAQIKGIKLVFRLDANLPGVIRTDSARLKQILCHLLLNALKFTYKGAITLSVVQCPDHANGITVTVRDTGIGMKEEEQKRLRERLRMTSFSSFKVTESAAGASMRTLLSQSLARKLGFSEGSGISFFSKPMEGSLFSFVLRNHAEEPSYMQLSRVEANDKATQMLRSGITVKLMTREASQNVIPDLDILKSRSNEALTMEELYFLEEDQYNEETENGNESLVSEQIDSKAPVPDFLSLLKKKDSNENCKCNRPPVTFHKQAISAPLVCTHPKIFVVDDDEFNILAVRSILKKMKFGVAFARNGAQAIEVLQQEISQRKHCCLKFLLILMDVNMPVMGGLEATRILKRAMAENRLPWMPIIGCTAFVGSSDEKICRENGMDDYETKPLNERKLTRLLQKWQSYRWAVAD